MSLGVHVGADIDEVRVAAHLLGTHVRKGALDTVHLSLEGGDRKIGFRDAGQAEIQDLDARNGRARDRVGRDHFVLDDDVRRFQVAVDDAALVSVGDGLGDTAKNREPFPQLRGGDRALGGRFLQVLLEGLAADQLHGKKARPRIGRPE